MDHQMEEVKGNRFTEIVKAVVASATEPVRTPGERIEESRALL